MDRKLYVGGLSDNRRWDMIRLRDDDVFVVTPPKCGTTWMQTIVALLLSGDSDIDTELTVKMPWVDIRLRELNPVAERINAMPGRRSLKSHTPLDGVPYSDKAQYLCVFRHPLDAHFSFRKHIRNLPLTLYDLFYPDGDEETTFRRFLDGAAEGYDMDAMPLAHILQHYKAAVALADQPNVTLFHYADMTRDLAGTIAKVADLLGVSYPDAMMDAFVEVATFEHMKANAIRYAPAGGMGFMKSDSDFFHSGSSGKWKGHLSDEQLDAYAYIIDRALDKDARRWLEYGSV